MTFYFKLINFFFFKKKLLDNKTFSTAFKIDIYHVMISIYSICDATKEIKHFESYCVQSIDKTQALNTHSQIASIEALSASLLLVTYLESDNTYGNTTIQMFMS